jgi:hypothetical protein
MPWVDGVSQITVPKSGKFWSDQTLAATVSRVFNVSLGSNFSVQVDWTGAATGAFTLLMCNDYREDETGAVTQAGSWTDITTNAVAKYPFCTKYGTDPAGATGGPVVIAVQQVPMAFLKLTYTRSAGTGVAQGYYENKST